MSGTGLSDPPVTLAARHRAFRFCTYGGSFSLSVEEAPDEAARVGLDTEAVRSIAADHLRESLRSGDVDGNPLGHHLHVRVHARKAVQTSSSMLVDSTAVPYLVAVEFRKTLVDPVSEESSFATTWNRMRMGEAKAGRGSVPAEAVAGALRECIDEFVAEYRAANQAYASLGDDEEADASASAAPAP